MLDSALSKGEGNINRPSFRAYCLILLLIAVTPWLSSCSLESPQPLPPTLPPSINVPVTYIGFGGQETISGSMHGIEVGQHLYLVDAGAFYGTDGENYPLPTELEVARIAAVFITHAHADHIGRLPLLFQAGYTGPLYMTRMTLELSEVVLRSSIGYADLGVESFYYSKNNTSETKPVYMDGYSFAPFEVQPKNRIYIQARRGELAALGFYMHSRQVEYLEEELLTRLRNQTHVVEFGERTHIKDVAATFSHSSHIPGSSMIHIEVGGLRLLFSGDVGSDNNVFLSPQVPLQGECDFLFLEATYGTNVYGNDYAVERRRFRELLGDYLSRGYRVIIPAFALDRTQQVIHEINRGKHEGVINKGAKVLAYSATSYAVSRIYERYYDLDLSNIAYNPPELDVLAGQIAVMTSGMASASFAHSAVLKYGADSNTVFVLVGYQAEESLGRGLADGTGVDGEDYEVKAEVIQVIAFSGHADFGQMRALFGGLKTRGVFVVHVDSGSATDVINAYEQVFGINTVRVPKPGERIPLN